MILYEWEPPRTGRISKHANAFNNLCYVATPPGGPLHPRVYITALLEPSSPVSVTHMLTAMALAFNAKSQASLYMKNIRIKIDIHKTV